MAEPRTRLSEGLALHQRGRLDDAVRIYQEVLKQQPNHFDALHLFAVAALQTGRAQLGVDLARKAVEVNGTVAAARVTLANGLRALGRFQEALGDYDAAVRLEPDYARAWHNRGNVLLETGHPDQAAESFDKALALEPNNVEAHDGRGNALCALNQPEAALASFDAALALNPGFAETWYNRGNALLLLSRFDEALKSHDQAVTLKPGLADAHSGRGNALWELKQPEAALAAYDKALTLNPNHADAYSNRCNALRDLKRFDEALASCDKALTLRPNLAAAHHNRGNALMDLKRPEEAVASYDRAIELNPNYARAYFNRGNALLALRRQEDAAASFGDAIARNPDEVSAYSNRGNVLLELTNVEEAIAEFDKAIAIQPEYAPAHCNRGNALVSLGRFDEAAASFREALDLDPDYVDAHWNDGLRLLLTGQFEPGWQAYEWRKRMGDPVALRSYPQPLWLGEEDIAGKTLFIYWEQGFGDTIQFCRYAKLAEARGAKVIMEVQRVLLPLLRQLSPTIAFITPDKVPSHFDCHCPVMSLPLAFRTTLDTIPAESRYLWADEMSSLLPVHASRRRPRIGIAWSGSTTHQHDHIRSIDLAKCLPLLGMEADWISLHKQVRDEDAAALRMAEGLAHFGDKLEDFRDTAALIERLDLVISVDTSVAHLAGAMGKPVWIMLPFSPDWRWLLNRDDSPWYPSARLFRQRRIGDWDSVIGQVLDAARSFIATFAPPVE